LRRTPVSSETPDGAGGIPPSPQNQNKYPVLF